MKVIRLLGVGLLAALSVWATNISGKWISEESVRDGNTVTVTMTFKTNHDKLTGAISGPYGEAEISEGKVEGSRVSFTVPGNRNGSIKFDQHYNGTIEGDTIHFTVTFGESTQVNRTYTSFSARRKFDAKRAVGN